MRKGHKSHISEPPKTELVNKIRTYLITIRLMLNFHAFQIHLNHIQLYVAHIDEINGYDVDDLFS